MAAMFPFHLDLDIEIKVKDTNKSKTNDKEYYLFVGKKFKSYSLPRGNWVKIKTFEEAVDFVIDNGFPTFLSIDHAFGEAFVRWMIERDMQSGGLPPNLMIKVHTDSSNTTIKKLLNDYVSIVK